MMPDRRLTIDTTAKKSETRIVRGTTLSDFWDAGLDDLIMDRRSGATFEATTIGALLASLQEELMVSNPPLAAALDRWSLEKFIRDMTANNFNITFTDELLVGKRLAAPTLNVGAVTPLVGSATFAAEFTANADVQRLYIHLLRLADDVEIIRAPATSLDAQHIATETINLVSGSYNGFCAGVDSGGLRGFKSDNFGVFTVS